VKGEGGLRIRFVEADNGRVYWRASEDVSKTALTELKNAEDIAFDEQLVDELASGEEGERDGVANAISDESSSVPLFEEVLVVPEGVGSADLFVHESEWRFPHADEGSPSDGQTVQAQAVVD
jgi:hypothetical protein